jgi:predicted TIM-barrel fold metal-dependent hydrolase
MSPFGTTRSYGKITPPDEEWLGRAVPEAALEPDLPIIDPHHHLWDNPRHRYMTPEFAEEIARSGHNVRATVYMNCWIMYRADGPEDMRPVGEVEFANGQAAMGASGRYGQARIAAAIVGHADPMLGARIRPTVEAEIAAGNGRLRGIRAAAGWDEDRSISAPVDAPGLYQRAEVQEALACLPEYGLSFDALVFHPQLADIVALSRALPDLPIVLNHMGQPLGIGRYGDRAEVFRLWSRLIRDVARCPNVTVKLGGLMLRLAVPDHVERAAAPPTSSQLADLWRPYVETCIELFGPRRCMFESNFPVEKMGIGYAALWNAFKRLADGCSQDEKRALFHDTAAQVYRL